MFPNPTTGQLTITNYDGYITSVAIYDNAGRLVERHATSLQSGGATINISHLPQGVYQLHINGEVLKVIKQ
ncbi:MAG: T9SS type A sorting domain-containing protein [Bacteroidales bacterium]|nr:T9SS type A sorting domain-containing protein [Bacteroidales bacterium]